MVNARMLRVLDIRPALLPLQYAAFYKIRHTYEFISSLVRLGTLWDLFPRRGIGDPEFMRLAIDR